MFKKKLSKIKDLLEDHPKRDKLINFLEKFYSKYHAEFIILFGSSAKGNFNYRSDIDLLIVSDSIKGNYFEKLKKLYAISPGGIDFFIYHNDEFDSMFSDFHMMALEPLHNGILLYDEKGLGKKYINRVNRLLKNGTLTRSEHSWIFSK